MALNNLWGKLGAFSRNVLVPSNVIYKSFDADPLVSDKMSRAISQWYGMYVDKPEWADDEVKPLGLPRAIAKEFAQVVSSEMTITADGGFRADFINEQLTRFQSNVQNSIELCMALGGMAFKPYVSGGNVFIDSTSAASFIPLRFDDGDNCVSGVFKSQPVKVDKSYFVKLEYHDFANGVYTIRNKAFTSDENGITGSEVELGRVPGKDIALSGEGDYREFQHWHPAIVTSCVDYAKLTDRVCDLIRRRTADRTGAPCRTEIPTLLIER